MEGPREKKKKKKERKRTRSTSIVVMQEGLCSVPWCLAEGLRIQLEEVRVPDLDTG